MTHYATRDAVLDSRITVRGRFDLCIVVTDTGVVYRVLGPAGPEQVYAISDRTGLVVLVTRTGRAVRSEQVRVRVDFPRDTNDVAGTVAFDYGHVGGKIWAGVFGL